MDIDTHSEVDRRMIGAQKRYGPFASTHEALGVCLEEWDELRLAVQANALESVREEALDLAAACLRLAESVRTPSFAQRSTKAGPSEFERAARLMNETGQGEHLKSERRI